MKTGNTYFIFTIFILLFAGCTVPAEKAAEKTLQTTTNLIYNSSNQPLDFAAGSYFFTYGPISVNKYSGIRLFANFSAGGPNDLNVEITNTDADGNILALIDSFILSSTGSKYVSKVYDVPGEFIKISYSSMSSYYVNLVIYGR
jgi:hypothetical protein